MSFMQNNASLAKIASPKLIAAVVCALAVLTWSASAFASTVLKLDLESLVANSEKIAEAQVVKVESKLEDGRVYTYTTMEVQEGLKGTEETQTVTVKQIGGRTEELTTWVPGVPHFQAGERVIVFLEQPTPQELPVVTGMAQGKFSVALGPDQDTPFVVPHLGNLALIEPLESEEGEALSVGEESRQQSGKQGEYRPARPADLYERVVPLDVFKQKVREVIRGQED